MHAFRLSPRSDSPPQVRRNGVALYDAPVYPYTSTFTSTNLELTVRSPRLRYIEDHKSVGHPIPVFDGKDSVGGTVTAIVPISSSPAYELVIGIEGVFLWIGPQKEDVQSLPLTSPPPKRTAHVFLSSSVTIPLSVSPIGSPKRQSALRSTLRRAILGSLNKPQREGGQTSTATLGTSIEKTFHSFTFQLPQPANRQIPGSVSLSRLQLGGLRGRWYAESAQVAYKVTAQLRSQLSEGEPPTYGQLEAPVIIESNADESDMCLSSETWSHSALTSSKTLPFQCTLFVSQCKAFARNDTIPFCISFTTSPRSVSLARQIMREANIHVTLVRLLRLDSTLVFPAPIPRTRRPEGVPSPAKKKRKRQGSVLRRFTTNASELFGWTRKRKARPNGFPKQRTRGMTPELEREPPSEPAQEKALPPLPQESVRIYEDVICSTTSEGFKKCVSSRSMPSSLPQWTTSRGHDDGEVIVPEGVFKGKLQLRNEISNTIDWPGLSLTYFVEAIVTFAGNVLETRHAVNILEPYHEKDVIA